MSVVTTQGESVNMVGAAVIREQQIQMGQDITIVRLRGNGYTWREIGQFLRMSASNAHWRYNRIPREKRDQYARLSPLG